MKALDLTGEVFGRLTVLEFAGSRRTSGGISIRTWLCACECGNQTKVDIRALKSGNTQSCGCYFTESHTSHGMHKHRVYTIWADMKNRCDSPNNGSYERYGGRGISYQESWKDFEEFWKDMQEGYSDELTLDRIDPNGNYTKDNCQWSTKDYQGRNRTMMVTNKTGVTGVRTWVDSYNGTLYYVAEAQGLGKKMSKHFSTNKYGVDEAFRLACEFRDKFINDFNESGVTFSEYHGKEKINE